MSRPVAMGRAGARLRGLYAITPQLGDTAALLAAVEPVLAAGAVLLQYRNKAASPTLAEAQARALLACCRAFGVPLIINDDAALARRVGADGVHLGRDDGDVAGARRILGSGTIVGVSCYDSLERARAAVAAGASYVAFGAFHPSATKPAAVRAGTDLLRGAAPLGVPRVAIGGITLENAPALIDAGADLLAVISDLFAHACADGDPHPRLPGARAAAYAALFQRSAAAPELP